MIILPPPANSQRKFAPNLQYCELQAEFAANLRCERIRSEFGEFKLNLLRICIPTLDGPKIEVFETYFFDIVTTQYDRPRYMFFTLFGY